MSRVGSARALSEHKKAKVRAVRGLQQRTYALIRIGVNASPQSLSVGDKIKL